AATHRLRSRGRRGAAPWVELPRCRGVRGVERARAAIRRGDARAFCRNRNRLLKSSATLLPLVPGGPMCISLWRGAGVVLLAFGVAPAAIQAAPLVYNAITPCRIVDTRSGPQAGSVASSGQRNFQVTGEGCPIPPEAQAVSVNLAVVSPTATGFIG